jgi:predicted phage terminase large subunit-like protein
MMQRTEGDSWKVIVIMTRWATDDLAGRIIAEYGEQVEHISYSAVQADGSMLSDSILNRENYLLKIKKMAHDIAEANYNQKPIDVSGRLYKTFNTYDTLPEGGMTYNYTDTADKGTDNLCSVNYQVHNFKVYVTGVVFSAEAMEDTEPQVAELLNKGSVTEAVIESNNGGRGFGRNVERLLREAYANLKTLVTPKVQTANKEARILASSAWVNANVIMPKHWEYDYPEFFSNLMDYQRKGKNAHDDAPDVLAGIYEAVTADQTEYLDADDLI